MQEAKHKAAAAEEERKAAEAKRKQEEDRRQAEEAKAKMEADKRKAEAAEQERKAAEAKRKQEEEKREQEEYTRKQETALNQLAEMGFTDRSGNKKLLEQSRNDVAAVVERLSQDASAAQRRVNEGGRGGAGEPGGGSGKGSCLEEGRSYVDTSRKLGSGSSGDVVGGTFRFPGQQQDTQVAFKIFRGGRNLAAAMSEKIEKEIQLGMQLLHPNLVRLFGMLNHHEHGPVLVLELCPGGSLRQALDRAHSGGITLPWHTRIRWLMEIASGLAQMHALLPTSIIHRDLKAANVLLSATNLDKAVAKVGDFGVATATQTLKSTLSAGGGTGTLAWMPPEAFGGKFSEKSDIFSLAVLMYEVMSLQLPHAGKSTAEITELARGKFKVSKALEKRGVTAAEQEQEWLEENPLHTRRPDLDLVQHGCPHALLHWVVKSWSDNPDNRPTFRETVEFLGKVLEGRPYWGEGGDGERVVLWPESKEQEAVVAAFLETMPANQVVSVVKVERVQNSTLWEQYAAKRRTMMQRQGAKDRYERWWLFHGTGEDTVLKIVAQGFNRNFGFKEINENALTMYGKGVYFAVDASYSSSHRYSKPNGAGEQQMFACRVLVGEYCQGKQDQPTPDVRHGTDLYDSTVDDVNKPEIFVAYHDAQAYPEYLITFKTH